MPYRPTPKTEAKKAETRGRLMSTARELFAEQGYESTTLIEIVKLSNSSVGSCYSYFPSKEAILVALAEEFRQVVTSEIDQAISHIPLSAEMLATIVYVGSRTVLANADLARIIMAETHVPSLRAVSMELFAAKAERALELMPEIFDIQKDMNPRLAAHAWHGSIYFVLGRAVNGYFGTDHEQVSRFLTRWNLQAIGLNHKVIDKAMMNLSSTRKKSA